MDNRKGFNKNKKKWSSKNYKAIKSETELSSSPPSTFVPTEPSKDIELNDTWILWSHELCDTNWDENSYSIVFEFNDLENFWKLYNNFESLGGLNKKDYFLMRKGIKPLWEDPNNRNGGICSLKIPITKSADIWSELSMYLVGESFFEDVDKMNDINGISICPKSVWSIIKIWNKDCNNNLEENLPEIFLKKYNKCSIKYRKNAPEY